MSLFVVSRVRDLEAIIGMVVPTHPHAVASLALHARQSVSSFHSLVKRLVKAKSLVDVLNCLIRFKDMNASIRLMIKWSPKTARSGRRATCRTSISLVIAQLA